MVVFLAMWPSGFVLGAFCIMHELNVLGDRIGIENDCFYVCVCIVKRLHVNVCNMRLCVHCNDRKRRP